VYLAVYAGLLAAYVGVIVHLARKAAGAPSAAPRAIPVPAE
jgi:hypothetical protein